MKFISITPLGGPANSGTSSNINVGSMQLPSSQSSVSMPTELPTQNSVQSSDSAAEIQSGMNIQTAAITAAAAVSSVPVPNPFASMAAAPAVVNARGKVEGVVERFKARIARAVKSFHDRISYEDEVARVAAVPVNTGLRRSVTRAVLFDTVRSKAIALTGTQQDLKLGADGSLTLCEDLVPAWQSQSSGDRITVRLVADGLEVQQGSSISKYISNDFLAFGQSRFLLKILGSNQGAENVHR